VGWVRFFLITTVITAPALLLIIWIGRRSATPADRESPVAVPMK
jgi:hypothetical protein